MPQFQRYTFHFDPELIGYIEQAAKKLDIHRTQLIRRLLRTAFHEMNDKLKLVDTRAETKS